MSKERFHGYDQTEPVTHLDVLVAIISKNADLAGAGIVRSMTVRADLHIYAAIEALSQYSGLSRNRISNKLLQVGLDELFEALPDEDREAVQGLQSEVIARLITDERESLTEERYEHRRDSAGVAAEGPLA